VKNRMSEMKRKEKQEKIAAIKENDRIELLLGNNGFIMKEGKALPMEVVYPPKNQTVKVDVHFVR